MVKIIARRIYTTQSKSHSLHQNFPFPPYPSNAIWKTLACFTFQSQSLKIISTYFSVWLWTVTQFNTPKNEMSLKVLLVIGNGFLIPTWKYWIWISKKESILRATAWKGVHYSSIQSCVWACHLVSLRKILTSLLDKCKKMTLAHPHFPKTMKTNQQWAEMM